MVILGIDPGYAIVGWGVIEYKGVTFRPVAFGAITTEAHTDFNLRLKQIYDDTVELLQHSKPDAVSIEKPISTPILLQPSMSRRRAA